MVGKGDLKRQISDWFLPTRVTKEQIEYAANNALIPLLLHDGMVRNISLLENSTNSRVAMTNNEFGVQNPSHTKYSCFTRAQKAKGKGYEGGKQRKNFKTLDTPSKILYGHLHALRNELMHRAGLFDTIQSRFVADTDSIFCMAREKPTTIAALQSIKKIKEATKGEYAYFFVNTVRHHLGAEGLEEPEEFELFWEGKRREECNTRLLEREKRNQETRIKNVAMIECWKDYNPRWARIWMERYQVLAVRCGLLINGEAND